MYLHILSSGISGMILGGIQADLFRRNPCADRGKARGAHRRLTMPMSGHRTWRVGRVQGWQEGLGRMRMVMGLDAGIWQLLRRLDNKGDGKIPRGGIMGQLTLRSESSK